MIVQGALLGLLLAAGQENRLWHVELELQGPCEAVRLDCGRDGETLLRGPFGSGEDRRLVLPVPMRSPLGSEGLASLPLPEVQLLSPGTQAVARVRGWSAIQPADALPARGPPALLRPPLGGERARPHAAELCVALAAGGFLLRFRRRLGPCLLISLGSSGLIFTLARARSAAPAPAEVLQWNAGSATAIRIRGAVAEIVLSGQALEVDPEGAQIRIEWEARGVGRAWVPRGSLFTLAPATPPVLAPQGNEAEPLEEVWTRTPLGVWRAHGSWALGAPLGPGRAGAPPGWIAGGLPPGTGILVARARTPTWLRCLGFRSE